MTNIEQVGAILTSIGKELSCPICLGIFEEPTTTQCSHIFCYACLLESLKTSSSCPLCKSSVTKRSLNPSDHISALVNSYKEMTEAFEEDSGRKFADERKWIEEPLENLSQLFPYPTKWKNSFEETPSINSSSLSIHNNPYSSVPALKSRDERIMIQAKRKIAEIDRELEAIDEQLSKMNENSDPFRIPDSQDTVPESAVMALETFPTDIEFPSSPLPFSPLLVDNLANQQYSSKICSVVITLPSSKPPIILASHLNTAQKQEIARLANAFGWSIATDSSSSSSFTHLIANTNDLGICRRTLKYLLALLDGAWIVSPNWIRACLMSQCRVNEADYVVKGDETCDADVPMKSRMMKAQRAANKPDGYLFGGLSFYLYGEFDVPSKDDLQQLIERGGGQVIVGVNVLKTTASKKTSTIVICDSVVQNSFEKDAAVIAKFKPLLSSTWILDCVSNLEIIENKYYVAF